MYQLNNTIIRSIYSFVNNISITFFLNYDGRTGAAHLLCNGNHIMYRFSQFLPRSRNCAPRAACRIAIIARLKCFRMAELLRFFFRYISRYGIIGFKKAGCDGMGMAEFERKKDEKIDGVICDMSPSPGYGHFMIDGNLYSIIKRGLKGSICIVSMENLDFKYHPDKNDDYLCPDIMIICNRKQIKGGAYSGIPKFVAETLSHSTAKKDRTKKKDIYEEAGVEEYWIISPQGSVEIYYLQDGKYVLEQNYLFQDDKEEDYNADVEISLRAFPHIKMTLGEIFEGVFEK